ncbi:hypothetical protein ACWIID_00735 [Streptomyces phaeochromogenes]
MLLVTVLLAAVLTGDDGAVATLKQNAVGILGNAALLSLAVTFAITPVTTVTGWRWHQILARDLGLWAFALAALDLVLAATMSTDGWRAGVAGQAFLAAGYPRHPAACPPRDHLQPVVDAPVRQRADP